MGVRVQVLGLGACRGTLGEGPHRTTTSQHSTRNSMNPRNAQLMRADTGGKKLLVSRLRDMSV